VRMAEAEKVVQIAATSLKTVGCVNYFGMQRLGKYFDNHKIGIELLNGNFEEAVNMIMKEKRTNSRSELPRLGGVGILDLIKQQQKRPPRRMSQTVFERCLGSS